MKRELIDSPDAYFLTEMVSSNNGRTASGFLVCTNVIAARTGTQKYTGREIGVQDPALLDEVFYLERTADEVFSSDTMKSFNAAAFTDGHPYEKMVNSMNAKELLKGFIQNVRKADFLDEDGNELLLVDVVVTDEDTIKSVERGKRQVSAGYSWDYDIIDWDARRVKVKNIRANHLALVDRGRAGSAMILDEDNSIEEIKLEGGESMSKKDKDIVHKFSLKDKKEIVEVRGIESKDEAREIVKDYYKNKEE